MDETNEAFDDVIEHISVRVPVVSEDDRAGGVRSSLVGKVFDTAVCVVVCQGDKFVGIIRIEDLLAAPDASTAAELMDDGAPTLPPGADLEEVAWRAVQHGESSLVVIDDNRHFIGVIPPDRLLAALLAEHDEDMARLGGFLRDVSTARRASLEAVYRRLRHRLPWLMIGLAGAFLAAGIVGSFEAQLKENVVLAFFMPGIIYMADAVGTQTETLVVRGLSVGVPIREVIWRELVTGLLVGAVLALTFVPVALWRWGEGDVVAVVALALFAACSVATLVAMSLPWLLHRLGKDPAFGSGPLATVIQDILSVLIYFTIAVNLL